MRKFQVPAGTIIALLPIPFPRLTYSGRISAWIGLFCQIATKKNSILLLRITSAARYANHNITEMQRLAGVTLPSLALRVNTSTAHRQPAGTTIPAAKLSKISPRSV